ncbi:MAG: helix-turn-helix transcriptional regulator [Clostridia bacterium]|nr:helix-turn-helix transcriptional regulator [Clostridia bacterium]
MRTREKEIGDQNIVGQKIKKIREEMNLSQKDFLAQLQIAGLDLSNSAISKLEGQFRRVTDRELLIISKTLKISVDDLLNQK